MDIFNIINLINSNIKSMGHVELLVNVFTLSVILKVIGFKVGAKDDSSN